MKRALLDESPLISCFFLKNIFFFIMVHISICSNTWHLKWQTTSASLPHFFIEPLQLSIDECCGLSVEHETDNNHAIFMTVAGA